MDVGQGLFYTCDARLRVAADDEGSTTPPPGWSEAAPAQEEALETLLVLNLRKVLGEDVEFLFRAGDYWGLQDITAIDSLGRIHLMELKKGKIDAKVVEQLSAYLLRTMFDDGVVFARRMAGLNRVLLKAERWAVYLAGALANQRTTVLGPKAYRTHVSDPGHGEALTDYAWSKQTPAQRVARNRQTLRALVEARGWPVLSPTALDAWGEEVRGQCQPPDIHSPPFRVRRSGVIWLVGRRVDEGALKQVQRWRRAGVDARPLVMDARQCRQSGRWMLRVLREDYPERAALIRQVAASVAANTLPEAPFRATAERPMGYQLELELYEKPPASSRSMNRGGAALRSRARAYLYNHTREEPVEVWSSEGPLR